MPQLCSEPLLPIPSEHLLPGSRAPSLEEKVWGSSGTVVLRGGGGQALAGATLPSGDMPPSSLSPRLCFPHDPVDPVPAPVARSTFLSDYLDHISRFLFPQNLPMSQSFHPHLGSSGRLHPISAQLSACAWCFSSSL